MILRRATAGLTRRKAAERSLRLLNANLEAVVAERTQQVRLQAMAMDAALEGVSILFEGRYIYMNHAHAAFYGYEREELLGEGWERLYGAEERARIARDIFPIVAETGKWSGETLWRRKDGSETIGEISLNTLPGGYLTCTCRDLTPRLMAQAALLRLSLGRPGRTRSGSRATARRRPPCWRGPR